MTLRQEETEHRGQEGQGGRSTESEGKDEEG